MDRDRKSPALKLLQGHIWERGYQAGELRGQVYRRRARRDPAVARPRHRRGDLLVGQRARAAAAVRVHAHGDLTPLMSAFFDTAVGAKVEAASYARIAGALHRPAGQVSVRLRRHPASFRPRVRPASRSCSACGRAMRPRAMPAGSSRSPPSTRFDRLDDRRQPSARRPAAPAWGPTRVRMLTGLLAERKGVKPTDAHFHFLTVLVAAVLGSGALADQAPSRSTGPERFTVQSDGHPMAVWARRAGTAERRGAPRARPNLEQRGPISISRCPGMQRSVLASLAAQGFAAYAVDLRGYGETPRDATGWMTPKRGAADLVNVLTWIAQQHPTLPRPALVGWSRGAAMAGDRRPVGAHARSRRSCCSDSSSIPILQFIDATAAEKPQMDKNTPESAASDFISPNVTPQAVIQAFVQQALKADPVLADLKNDSEFNIVQARKADDADARALRRPRSGRRPGRCRQILRTHRGARQADDRPARRRSRCAARGHARCLDCRGRELSQSSGRETGGRSHALQSSLPVFVAGALITVALAVTNRGSQPEPDIPGTFSILGFDPETGAIGAAVQSRVFSVGNGVIWAEPGIGAVATQAIVDVGYGPKGIELLRQGMAPAAIIKKIWDEDPDPGYGKQKAGRKPGASLPSSMPKARSRPYTGPSAPAQFGDAQGKFVHRAGQHARQQGHPARHGQGVRVVGDRTRAGERTHLSLRLVAALEAGAGGRRRQARSAVRGDPRREEGLRRLAAQRRRAAPAGR